MTQTVQRRVPGPRGSLLLGMARELQRDQLGTYETVMAEYGDIVRLVVGPPGLRRVLYLVTHPDGVAQVLAATGGYTKDTPFYEEIAAYLGDGLLTSDGGRWRQQRRIVAPLFSHRRVAGSVAVMADEAARLAARWSVAAERRVPVDLDAEMVGSPCARLAGSCSGPMSTRRSRWSGRPSRSSTATCAAAGSRRCGYRGGGRPRPSGGRPARGGRCTASSTRSSTSGAGLRPTGRTWSRCCWPPATRTPARRWTRNRSATSS